jgi:hypothetical protein
MAQRPGARPDTPDRHLPQRTLSTMRRVVTDFDNSKKLYAAPIPAALVR